jgi:hypothetical protein
MSSSDKNTINKISYNAITTNSTTIINSSSNQKKKKSKKECTSISSNSSLVVAEQQADSMKCSSSKKHDRDEDTTDESNLHTVNTKSGIDCIDELFAKKKELKKKKQCSGTSSDHNNNNKKDDDIHHLITSSHGGTTKKAAKKLLHGDRSDLERLQSGEWVDDGLGGKFNSEGFTGRRDDQSGYKVYKAHLLNKKGFGTTSLCPFDCDCCFI